MKTIRNASCSNNANSDLVFGILSHRIPPLHPVHHSNDSHVMSGIAAFDPSYITNDAIGHREQHVKRLLESQNAILGSHGGAFLLHGIIRSVQVQLQAAL
jgi:hypothetical protein